MSKYFKVDGYPNSEVFLENGSFNHEFTAYSLLEYMGNMNNSNELMEKSYRALEWIMHEHAAG